MLEQDISITRTNLDDFDSIKMLCDSTESGQDSEQIMKQIISAVKDNETPMLSFCARVE